MDLILTISLLVIHQVTSCLCKPTPELSAEDKFAPAGNYASVAEFFKDVNTETIISPGSRTGDLEDKRNVLHMIQLLHKDGRKAPVAIILTPADLTTDISKSHHVYDNQNKKDDMQEQRDDESEIKSKEVSLDADVQNRQAIVNKTFDSHDVTENVPSEDLSPVEELPKEAQNSHTLIVEANEETKDLTDTDNAFEPKSEVDDNISDSNENIVIDKDVYNEKVEKYEDAANIVIEDARDINADESLEAQILSKLDEIGRDANDYITIEDKATDADEVIPENSLRNSELDKEHLSEKFGGPNNSVQHKSDPQNFIDNLMHLMDMHSAKTNGMEHPTIYVDDGKLNQREKKLHIKRKYSESDTRTYNLSFVFNR